MKEVIFLIPTRLTRGYFLTLYQRCEQEIYKRFGDELRPIARGVPRETKEFDPKEVLSVLEREFHQSGTIGYLVVAPTSSRPLAQGVAEIAKRKNIPVIALSLPFPSRVDFEQKGLQVPPSVVSDSESATRQLGIEAAAELKRRRLPSETVCSANLVLMPGGRRRIDSVTRLISFDSGLREAGIETHCKIAKFCEWRREEARKEMTRILAQSKDRIDVIFAANDEMALGARQAVLTAKVMGNDRVSDCMIFGFDAIDEVVRLIQENDLHFKGTVEQDLDEMATSLVDILARGESGTVLSNSDSIRVTANSISKFSGRQHVVATTEQFSADQVNSKSGISNHKTRDLKKPEKLAYFLFKHAVMELESIGKTNVADEVAYKFLVNHDTVLGSHEFRKLCGDDGYDLPSLDTWTRYLRTARKYLGERKNTPVAGRTGRSIVDGAGERIQSAKSDQSDEVD